MIESPHFVCGHIPRTGGDAAAKYFKVFANELNLHIDRLDNHAKHDPFWRRDNIAGKVLVLTIRRLPSWMLGYVNFAMMHGLYPLGEPCPAPSVRDITDRNSDFGSTYITELGLRGPLHNIGDRYLRYFTNENRLKVDYYLKMEDLKYQIVKFVSGYTDVTSKHFERLDSIETKESLKYDHDVRSHWPDSVIRQIYRNNPWWATLERQVYGNDMLT